MFERHSNGGCAAPFLVALSVLLIVPETVWAVREEIIVTTRKKAENLQDVPIAVDAFTEQQIQRNGITGIEDVVKYSPSVQFDTTYNPTDTRVNVRGLSATRGRSNVAFLVDGIDVTTENVISAGSGLLANQRLLNDLERIEVVKGPQSALYGRAAFAGAISYITKEPGDEFESELRLDLADDGYMEGAVALGGPVIGDVLGIRVNGVYWEDDGQFTNSVSGNTIGGGDGYGTSMTAVVTPGDRLKFKARVEYSDDHYDQAPNLTFTRDTPLPYPEDAFLAGLTGGVSRDYAINPDSNSGAGASDADNGRVTISMRDHGLYCNDILPEGLTRDESQLALKQMFPDYPTVSADWIADNFPGLAENELPMSLQTLSDGSQPLVPGWCQLSSFGSGSDGQVMLSENAATGNDWKGTDVETFRASLLSTLDYEYGSFSLNLGYTDSTSSIALDQDYQTRGRPDTSFNSQRALSTTDTDQTSAELRFTSDWDNSPVQLTLGALYWNEEREVLDQNYIIGCLARGRNGDDIDIYSSGLCDGQQSNNFGLSVDTWQAFSDQLDHTKNPDGTPRDFVGTPGGIWEPETDHKSAYVMVEWALTEKWTLTLEDRYVDESFDLSKPNFSSCTNLGFGIGGGFIAQVLPFLDESDPANAPYDARCSWDQFDQSDGPVWWSSLDQDIRDLYIAPKNGTDVLLPGYPLFAQDGEPGHSGTCNPANGEPTPLGIDPNCVPYGNIVGSQDSSYHTPKVTLRWFPTDDAMFWFSWGKGRKPAGINAISSGGAATTIDEERFDSEIMENWELGWKTSWELAGNMQFNGAFFYQDYTDKQIGTQILVPDGNGGFRSNPRVINASAAEVWGLELEAVWQPEWVEGLVLQGGYTFLDTQYTDFVDETTTFIRAAGVGECNVVWKDAEDNTVATGPDDPNLDPNLYPVEDREFDIVSGNLFPIYAPKCALELTGNELERAPQNAFVGNVSLTRPFLDTGMDWFTSFNAVYQDERFIKADNFIKWDDYWLFDFQLGLMSERVDVLFYVENLFDDDTIRSGGEGPDFGPTQATRGFSAGLVQLNLFGPLPPPRRAGIRLSFRFK